MTIHVPARLRDACAASPDRTAWLERLPATIAGLEHRWSLTLGMPFDGDDVGCAWVAPATVAGRVPAVLKLAMPHFEGAHEIDGLRVWNGDAMVQLLDADDALGAMLIERCEPGSSLREMPEAGQDVVIAGLLRRLRRAPAAPHPFRPLAAMVAYWRDEAEAQRAGWRDAALVEDGLQAFDELARGAHDHVLLATDLHAGNVLRARREPWLAIDPKPFVGDPAFDATQHLLNCRARLLSNRRDTIRRFGDLLEVSHERVRLWTFARAAVDSGSASAHDDAMPVARLLARP